MRKNHWLARLSSLLLAGCTVFAVTVLATGSPGSEGDPLVTLSYLNETFMAQLLGRVDDTLELRDRELSDKLDRQMREELSALPGQQGTANTGADAARDFTVVTLSNGQTLRGEIGCEVMLRVGTASCVAPSSPGLIDETDASTLGGGGELVKNHLYMMTIDERGVKATAATTKLLVRGSYTIS